MIHIQVLYDYHTGLVYVVDAFASTTITATAFANSTTTTTTTY